MSRDNLDAVSTLEVLSRTGSYHSDLDQINVAPLSSRNRSDFGAVSDFQSNHSAAQSSTHLAIAMPNTVSSLSCVDRVQSALYHFIDFSRITFVTQTLFSRWLRQLFFELDRYGNAPSTTVQQDWLGYPIFSMAAFLSVIVKTLNARSTGGKFLAAQDYLFAAFCSSTFYFFLDLWSGAESMPLLSFVATSAIALPLAAAFLSNLALPDSDNRFYLYPDDLAYIKSLRYTSGKMAERTFNLLSGAGYGAASLTTLFWTINREVHGKTVSLPWWQILLVGMGIMGCGKLGYDLSDDPIRFQKTVMLAKFFKDSALTYAALSGIFFVLFHDKPYFSDEGFKVFLIMLSAIVSLGIGLYSAVTTRFRFEENVVAIEKKVDLIQHAPERIATVLAVAGNKVMGLFAVCCPDKTEDDLSAELIHAV